MCMGTKTITVMDDAYSLLARKKLRGESFSGEIRRLLGGKRRDFSGFGGAWKTLSASEIGSIKKKALLAKKSFRPKAAEW